jgi:hypothetical protein
LLNRLRGSLIVSGRAGVLYGKLWNLTVVNAAGRQAEPPPKFAA